MLDTSPALLHDEFTVSDLGKMGTNGPALTTTVDNCGTLQPALVLAELIVESLADISSSRTRDLAFLNSHFCKLVYGVSINNPANDSSVPDRQWSHVRITCCVTATVIATCRTNVLAQKLV